MGARENLILNPVEFTPNLPEIDLSGLGIAIGPAAPDYGESSVSLERIKREVGEGISSRQWPSIECSVPLIVSADPSVTQAEAYGPLEAFVAEVQRRSRGWIRRDFAEAGGYSGSVASPVDAAGIITPKGKGRVDEITLKMMRHPFWFATTEVLAGEGSGSNVRDLQFMLAELLGTAPGLIRVVVKNEGEEDWRGCMVSIECDSFSSASTAEPKYEAKELTLQGGSEVKTVSGAEVVKCPVLTKGWVTVLSSEISGVGHMTHVEPRRMAFRLLDPSTETDAARLEAWEQAGGIESGPRPEPKQVQWKLEWRALGSANWIQTREGSTPLIAVSPTANGYQVVDLGECRPEEAITGEQRWEWRLQACSPSGAPLQPLIRDVYPASTEQWLRVADASSDPSDGAPAKDPGTVVDATGTGTKEWKNPERAETSDSSYASVQLESEKVSHFLKATNFGFAIPADATILGIEVSVQRQNHVETSEGNSMVDNAVRIVKGGVIGSTDRSSGTEWRWNSDEVRKYGGASDLWGEAWTPANINASTFGAAISAKQVHGLSTAQVNLIAITVYYAESANTETHICFATRSIEFADNGVRRQHATDEVWGDVVPEGMLLHAPVGGQEGKNARGLVIPSVGDFDTRADLAASTLSAKAYVRPAYLFAREAA